MLLLLLSTLGGYLVVCSAENSTVPTAGTGPSTSSSSMETPAVSVPTTTTDIIVVDCYGAARLSACFVPNSCVVGKCFNGECERIDPYETNLGVECARYKDALARRRTTSEPLGATNTTAASSGSGTVTAIALSVVAGLVAILAFVCAIIWWSRTRSADLITPRDSKASVLPLTSSPPPRKEGTRLSFRGVARGLPLPVGAAKREPIAVKDDAEWAPPAVEVRLRPVRQKQNNQRFACGLFA